MGDLAEHIKPSLAELLLALADDKLVLGHRNSEWTGLGPILEEDIAFSALAQDEIAHAQAVYELVGPLVGKSADELAFGREPAEYRNRFSLRRTVNSPVSEWGRNSARTEACRPAVNSAAGMPLPETSAMTRPSWSSPSSRKS